MTIPRRRAQDLSRRRLTIEVRSLVRDGDVMLCQGKRSVLATDPMVDQAAPGAISPSPFRIKDSLNRVVVVEAVEKIGVRCVALSDFVSRDSAGTSLPIPARSSSPAIGKLSRGGLTILKGPGAWQIRLSIGLGSRFAASEIAKIALRIAASRLMGDRKTPRMLLP